MMGTLNQTMVIRKKNAVVLTLDEGGTPVLALWNSAGLSFVARMAKLELWTFFVSLFPSALAFISNQVVYVGKS